MPLYRYQALSKTGTEQVGVQAAGSEAELREALGAQGLFVQHVRAKRHFSSLLARRRIDPEQFLLFNQELIALFRAGLTVPDALQLTRVRPQQPDLAHVLSEVLERVRRGERLSVACTQFPEVFDRMYLAALATGERTGNLVDVLQRYQAHFTKRIALRRKVAQAMAYPLFLLASMVVVIAVLFTFVMPRFTAMYQSFHADLPTPTRWLLAVADHIGLIAGIVLIGVVLGKMLIGSLKNNPGYQLRLDALKEKLPGIGSLVWTYNVATFCRTLSTLLTSGMPLIAALKTTEDTAHNRAYAARLVTARHAVEEGKGLAQSLTANRLLPATAAKLVEVGEVSGNLESMLGEAAEFFEDELELRMSRAMTLIEPALMLAIGLFIGGIIVTMYLPIFNMANIIQ